MRRGVCPKCQTPTVYRKLNGVSRGSAAGAVIFVYTSSWSSMAPSDVESFICARCGYFESYIVDEAKLAEITNTWEKVG